MSSVTIHVASELDITELIPLMRAYCDDSDEPHVAKPSTEQLTILCHDVLNDTKHNGIYLLARNENNQAVGFAALFWSWTFIPQPGRQAILSDLYVNPNARGLGIAGALIEACKEQARQYHNIHSIIWQTASDNYSAQKVYERLGVLPKKCVDYELVLLK
ncbi:unnamed protein product [Adineta steineri]|uniref:N-acetyltransferase domain-containing protein n=1 Tax=Adineta steineri TaxID=433720 RepID=A0A814H4N6_9BILA|nr:unnamed protein product [Adineta steineri]